MLKLTGKIVATCLALGGLAACDTGVVEFDNALMERAELMAASRTGLTLESLPAPTQPLDVAVYAFPDLTGANENQEDYAELSRAVTQGGADLLTDVLRDVGGGSWFTVVERARDENLLREREIIERTQTAFTGRSSLPPLRFAGTLIEGSIVGYDSNIITGGSGARYLGIGNFNEYRRDIVTVSLRAVSVSTGRVLTSVTTTKTIYSVLSNAGVFRFAALDEVLELEFGFSRNEPEIFAVREAMELAVFAMLVEGVEEGHWSFANKEFGDKIVAAYKRRYEAVRVGEKGEGSTVDPVGAFGDDEVVPAAEES